MTTTRIDELELAHNLRLAVMRLARRLRQAAPDDMPLSQLSALARVSRLKATNLSDLAGAERVSTATMCRLVDALEERGLVERKPSPTDQRAVQIVPARAGGELIAEYRRRRDAYLASHIRDLSDEDREVLSRAAGVLERLAEAEN